MILHREIRLPSATFLVIGNIIGVGIFTTTGLIIMEIGPSLWLLGVWIVGGMLALTGAMCYATLGIHMPHAGGEYAFLYPTYGPLPAFLAGWTSLFVGFSAPIAAGTIGLAYYLSPLLPQQLSQHPFGLKIVASGVLIIISTIVSSGLHLGTGVHSGVTFLTLVLIIGYSAVVLTHAPIDVTLTVMRWTDGPVVDLPSLASAIVLVMFAYSGWNAAAYIIEELRDPERTLGRALLIGTTVVIATYIFINLAYLAAAPLPDLEGEIAVAHIAASQTLGPGATSFVNLLIVVSILSSITAMSIAGPRVYFAMSRHHLFPTWLSDVHAARKVPLKAIWFQNTIALALIWGGTLQQVLLYSGFLLILFSTVTVSVLLTIPRRKGFQVYSLIRYRLLPTVFIGTNAGVLINAVTSHPHESLVGIGTVALGLPVYLYFRRKTTERQFPPGIDSEKRE